MNKLIIDVEAVTEWWRLAAQSINQQIEEFTSDENAVKEFVDGLCAQFEEALKEAPDDVDTDDAREAFQRTMEESPCHLVLGKAFSDIVSVFMTRMAQEDFVSKPGTKIELTPITAGSMVVGVNVTRSVDEDAVMAETDRCMVDIEAMLAASIVPVNSADDEPAAQ